MKTNSKYFGQLLKAGISSIAYCEGKTAPIIEEDLGVILNLSASSIQYYKAGNIPSNPNTIRILAEACVNRGYLNVEWLKKFLLAAHYPNPKDLIEQLYPSRFLYGTIKIPNLPSPTYNQFVDRDKEFNTIIEGFNRKKVVIMIYGMRGIGKTSLAYEIAYRCLSGHYKTPKFDICVWVSDKDSPGRVNLNFVLDEIARTLDYPGIIQLSFEEKQIKIEQLLRQRKTLIIIDNFETIIDIKLSKWIGNISDPSKVIITTSERKHEIQNPWMVNLSGMTQEETKQFTDQIIRSSDLNIDVNNVIDSLTRVTHGNPKAIEIILGFIKSEGISAQEALDRVTEHEEKLFDHLFIHAWSLLNKNSRQVWLSLILFRSSANPSAVEAVSGVGSEPFKRAIAKLLDLSLINEEIFGSETRLSLHPLARSFLNRKIREYPDLEKDSRNRWIDWCCSYASGVGWCWDDLDRLDLLDIEHDMIFDAIQLAYQQGHHEKVITIQQGYYEKVITMIEGIRYYYNVRGIWDDRLIINTWRSVAARKIKIKNNKAINDEALGIAHHVEINCKQGKIREMEYLLVFLEDFISSPDLRPDVIFEIRHAQASYAFENKKYKEAEQIWKEALKIKGLVPQMYIITRRWLAACRHQQGDLTEAERLYQESWEDAIKFKDYRSVMGNALKLGDIALEKRDVARAEIMLNSCRSIAEKYQDRRRLAEMYQLQAKICYIQGHLTEARNLLYEAINHLERLGNIRKLEEVHDILQKYYGEKE